MKQLSGEQQIAAEALGCGKSNRATAVLAKVSEGTIRNWLKLPDFQSAVKDARKEYQGKVERKLSGYALRAAETVGMAGAMKKDPSASQLAAAKLTLQAIGVAGDKVAIEHGGKVGVAVSMDLDAAHAELEKLAEKESELIRELSGGKDLDAMAVRMWLHSRGLAFPGEGNPGGMSLCRCQNLALREAMAEVDAGA